MLLSMNINTGDAAQGLVRNPPKKPISSFDQLVLLGRKLTRLGSGQAAMLELNCMSRESCALVHEYKYRRCCTGACEKPSKETNQLFFVIYCILVHVLPG